MFSIVGVLSFLLYLACKTKPRPAGRIRAEFVSVVIDQTRIIGVITKMEMKEGQRADLTVNLSAPYSRNPPATIRNLSKKLRGLRHGVVAVERVLYDLRFHAVWVRAAEKFADRLAV